MEHILLLEDDVLLRAAMARSLRSIPEVEISAYGFLAEAVASIGRKPPSLVVLDIQLPDGSGLDLLPELALRGLKVPMIVVSAHLSRCSGELLESPNIEALAKPFDPAELRRVVQSRLALLRAHPTPAFAVADYLQLAGLARRSVALEIHDGPDALGRILVENGEPRFAEDRSGSGQGAFQRLALAANADVSCRPLNMPMPTPNLSGSLEQLLLEAARRSDEGFSEPVTRPGVGAEPTVSARRRGRSSGPPAKPSAGQPPPLPPRPRRPSRAPSESAAALAPSGGPAPPAPVAAPLSPSQEANVIPIRPNKLNLNTLLTVDSTLRAVARADRQGGLLDSVGEFDAETVCAVAMMASRHVSDASEDLGLGRPTAWHVTVAASTWYVVHAPDSLIVAIGGQGRNAMSTLRKVAKECGI